MHDLLVIGGGVAGLSAGIYAARSGYRTAILERAATPGGLCTSWWRRGYRFDGSVAGLAGTDPDMPIYRLWQDLGVIDYCPLYDPEDFGTVVDPQGRAVTIYTDIDRLERHLLETFPTDHAPIREFAHALRACTKLDIPFRTKEGWAATLDGLCTAAGSLGSAPLLVKYSRLTLRRFLARLADPFCREVFSNLVHFGGPDVPLLTVLLPLAYAHRRATGIPVHGWLSFARALERRFVESGGEITYGAMVATVVRAPTGNGERVAGVRLTDGTVLEAGRVLSAADGRFTHEVLLGEDVATVDRIYDPAHLSDQPVQVNLGVSGTVATTPGTSIASASGSVTYLLPDAPSAGGRPQRAITVHTNVHDPEAAPPGKRAVTAFLTSDYCFWKALEADRPAYVAEKERCAHVVTDAIERHHAGFASAIEVVDVSTPLTRERYTGNWRGAMQARRPDAGVIRALLHGGPRYDHTTLKGFWMAGQWVESWGGITTAAQSGRNAVQAMCKKDGVRFAR